ncbi:MAG: hypothetical protein WCY49_07170 [Anaerovoracaceae bacterium]
MTYKKDSLVVSVVWGRIGAAVICIVVFILELFGIIFSAEEVAQLNDLSTGIIAGVAGIMVIASKAREKKKLKE